jgi:hypothetical protein
VVESLGSLRHGTNHAPPTWEAQSGLSTLFHAARERSLAQEADAAGIFIR